MLTLPASGITNHPMAHTVPWMTVQFSGLWVSKLQTAVALSTTEAEYIACSQSYLFPVMVLLNKITTMLGLASNTSPHLPIQIHEDNVEALTLSQLEAHCMIPHARNTMHYNSIGSEINSHHDMIPLSKLTLVVNLVMSSLIVSNVSFSSSYKWNSRAGKPLFCSFKRECSG